MFDSRKIDAYFEGTKPLVLTKHDRQHHKLEWTRVVKLGFPCLAAAIFGVMVVLPNIKKNTDIQNEITLPRKSELEKLHVEQTVLNATDRKNRVSTVWADSMDEIEAGSEEIKIINPRAEIPSDNGLIKIFADFGYTNQKSKVLRLEQNIKITDENQNVLETEEAIYEFESEFGHGDKVLSAKGNWGTLEALNGFTYDKNSAVLTLLGQTVIKTPDGTLTSHDETKIFRNENKVVSIGKVKAERQNYVLLSDKMINYFSSASKKELEKTEALGNVEIITNAGTAKAARAVYLSKQGTAELFGNVVIISQKGTAKGDRAVYHQNENTVDLYGNVILEQDENFMYGNHAHTDLNTSVSTITADKKQGSRVSGTFYNKRKADNGKKTN